jgi:hypothetical protein
MDNKIKVAKCFADRLAHGETLDQKDIKDFYSEIENELREMKNNCANVLRQLKKVG